MRVDMALYDQAYYDQYTSQAKTYNVLRPVRKALRKAEINLPNKAVAVVFAFGFVDYYRVWRKAFGTVWGYDINPYFRAEAETKGLADFLFLQDVAESFMPKRGHVATCQYLMEHLTDAQSAKCILNMARAAPLNVYTITDVDNCHYTEDPTHINPKTAAGWRGFLTQVYKQLGFVNLVCGNGLYAFWDQRLKSQLATSKISIQKVYD